MVYFLTSYYAFPGTNTLNTDNGFARLLKAALPRRPLRAVCVASSPEDLAKSERHTVLDGLRLYEDVAFLDSMGRCFYSLPDGSFLHGDGRREALYGEAWRIRDGVMEQVCHENEILPL